MTSYFLEKYWVLEADLVYLIRLRLGSLLASVKPSQTGSPEEKTGICGLLPPVPVQLPCVCSHCTLMEGRVLQTTATDISPVSHRSTSNLGTGSKTCSAIFQDSDHSVWIGRFLEKVFAKTSDTC